MIAVLTGAGLSAAAGFNAYIPFLVVALLARYTEVVQLPQAYAWMENGWVLTVGLVLLAVEVVLDKVPAVDWLNDAVQSFVRPAVGGVIFAATSAASEVDHSTWMQEHAWVGVVLGGVVAALVHSGKAVVRPAVNAATLGSGAPVVSTLEDSASIGLSLLAVFVPVLVVVALGLLLVVPARFWWQMRRKRRPSSASRVSSGR